MHLPSALPFHATNDANGSFLGPAELQTRKAGIGGSLREAVVGFVIAPPAQEGVAAELGRLVGPDQTGGALVSLAMAAVPESAGVESGSLEAGDSALEPEQSVPGRGGFGQNPDDPAIVAESPDLAEAPARIDVEEVAAHRPDVIPTPEPIVRPPDPVVSVVKPANNGDDGDGPLMSPGHRDIAKGQPLAPTDPMRRGDAGSTQGSKAVADHSQGNTVPARNGLVSDAIVEPLREAPVSAPIPGSPATRADQGVSAPIPERQRGWSGAESQAGSPLPDRSGTVEPDQNGIVEKGRAVQADDVVPALRPDARPRASGVLQGVSDLAFPGASVDAGSRPQAGGEKQAAPEHRLTDRDGAPAPAGSLPVASQSGGLARIGEMEPVLERSPSNHVAPVTAAEATDSQGPDPNRAAPVATLDQAAQLMRRADAPQTALAVSAVADVDPLRPAEAVPGDFRTTEIASNPSTPGPSPRADQGRAIAVQIAEVLRVSGERAVELRLQPEELGRVSLTMSQEGGHLQITLLAERAETLEMMRRHIDLLGEELRRLGHGSVEFLFRDGAGQNRQGAPQTPGSGTPGESGNPTAPDPPPAATRLAPLGASGLSGGMDIRM